MHTLRGKEVIGKGRYHGEMSIPFPDQRTRQRSDSYPSLVSVSSSGYDSENEAAMIQEEWEESLRQLETVVSIILIPFFGRWYGRRFAYWGRSSCHVITWGVIAALHH